MIVTKLDRLARSTEDGLNLVKHWHEQGISILAREDKAVKILAFAFWRIKHQAESLKNVNSKPFLPEKARIMTEYMKLVKAFGRREMDSSQS